MENIFISKKLFLAISIIAVGVSVLPVQNTQAMTVTLVSHELKRTIIASSTLEECNKRTPNDNCHLFYVGCKKFEIYVSNKTQERLYTWYRDGYEIEATPVESGYAACIIENLY